MVQQYDDEADSQHPGSNRQLEAKLVEASGVWPFVSRRVFQSADGSKHIWSSRHHRKGLVHQGETTAEPRRAFWDRLSRCLWAPRRLNWWIAILFATGAALFAAASLLSLAPRLTQTLSLSVPDVNKMFFAGSIPFTLAAYLQLYQSANAGEPVPGAKHSGRRVFFGWQPGQIGWLSSALQFVGTILFNFNTFDAMLPSLNWFQQDLLIWVPDVAGSVLFLVSGYLAFVEICHAVWAWRPQSLSWWVVLTNLLGCVAFMISAVCAFIRPVPNDSLMTLSVWFTLIGAIGFLLGSFLMLPEMSDSIRTDKDQPASCGSLLYQRGQS